ncbi:hypothetical protein [Flammeovirga agarivorans]|uniref:Uncharacterized protein n=1 Tax=Flammeovirga agarivorans TaxID=2726742 RepID=A0A7X8XWA2_9BACT|nr:hypothetical protein [Flammeovirga agarivorans]NLR92014.1 hypothetical protein [Flammeovirga agarivorans]
MSIEEMQNMYGSNNVKIQTYNRKSNKGNPIADFLNSPITDKEYAYKVAQLGGVYMKGGVFRVIQKFEDGELTRGKALSIIGGSIVF